MAENSDYVFSPLHKLGSGELVCKVHLVQLQLKYIRVHVQVHLSSQAWISVLEHEKDVFEPELVKFSPLFRSTSSI